MKNFVTGAQLYSVRKLVQEKQSIDDTFAAISAMGYTTCQLSGQNRAIEPEFYADMLKKHGLKCVVTHNSMQDFEEGLDDLIRRHHIWNCRYAGIGSMPGDYKGRWEGYRDFALKMNGIAKKLKDEGITFVYHNHMFEFSRVPDGHMGMDVLFDYFGDNAQFELDTFWVQAGGANPVSWIRKVNGRMDVMHFKDMMGGAAFGGQFSVMVPVGSGNLEWLEIKKACEETGVLYAEVEQDNASDMEDPLGQMKISAENLKKMGFTL